MSDSGSQFPHAVDVVIPALNEEQSIREVLGAIPSWVRRVVVVDNGSTDLTASVARSCGAEVVREPRRGYGAACLRGLAELSEPDIVVFVDADRSDRPEEMAGLVQPIADGTADLVIGSRVLGNAEPGSLTLPQRFGNRLSSSLIRLIWGVGCTDLGPFRAVRFDVLRKLRMDDLDYGWTVQMQTRAARMNMRMVEVPVSYQKRIGVSKISGTVRGVVGAGTKILATIARESLRRHFAERIDERLVVFSRLPIAGTTKTRLIPALGEQGAADLQRDMTRYTLDVGRRWREHESRTLEVRFTGGSADEMRSVFGDDVVYVDQGQGSLGDRMHRAFCDGSERTVVIGSDCPGITPPLVRKAFAALDRHDVVIGPAADGGYYLLGMRAPQAEIFRGIDWGSASVFAQTIRRCRSAGVRVATLDMLVDVDEPADMEVWEAGVAARDRHWPVPALSVVIPTLNEASRIEEAIRSIGAGSDVEIIVADGGSEDATMEIAGGFGARVVTAPRGRAAQMNAGAAVARGDVLLFLHADTRLPFGYRAEIDRILAEPNVAGGAFRFALDHVTLSLRLIERGTNFRSRWMQLPYGDQAIFLPRSTFEQLNGFMPWPVMEDFDFVRRLRRRGNVRIADSSVITSARRWTKDGSWRTTMRHQIALIRYTLGQSPDSIAAWLGRDCAPAEQPYPSDADHAPDSPPPSADMGSNHACDRIR